MNTEHLSDVLAGKMKLTLKRNRLQNETLIQQISDGHAYKIEQLEARMMKYLAQANDYGLSDFKQLLMRMKW